MINSQNNSLHKGLTHILLKWFLSALSVPENLAHSSCKGYLEGFTFEESISCIIAATKWSLSVFALIFSKSWINS